MSHPTRVFQGSIYSSHRVIRCMYDTHTTLLGTYWQDGNFRLNTQTMTSGKLLKKFNHT